MMTDCARRPFGTMPDGQVIEQVTLRGGGMVAQVLTLGAIVQDLRMAGSDHPLVLGADTAAPYLDQMRFFGAIVGRFANRIAGATFELDGHRYRIGPNCAGGHALHGGPVGSSQRLWDITAHSTDSVTLQLHMPDGEMGFPGNLRVVATLSLPATGTLQICIQATTDKATPCSFAHHGYFILDDTGSLAQHSLQIRADHYLPVDDTLIPTGKIEPVANTAFDYRTARDLKGQALDHNFCLSMTKAPLRPVALLRSRATGLSMRMDSTEPGLQVYTASQFPVTGLTGLGQRRYGRFAGVALEAQAWPDSPNQPRFPLAILRPHDQYQQTTRYIFHDAQTLVPDLAAG
ncbi:aldose epimerase family protein [Roseinatronobacter sp. NSM]|uniref:aldose epimerase family protein n=1 Tax=Roseinatronobacter sp. NSM TaxID=3457785 RepID=UPI004037281F